MAEFEPAFNFVLVNEGEFVDSPNDSGGATKFGLSLRFLRMLPVENLRRYGIFESAEGLGVGVVRDLTIGQAQLIYKGEFWDGLPFKDIEYQRVCNYYFDMCINFGVRQATKLLQRSIWAACLDRTLLRDDGICGERTIGWVNRVGTGLIPVLVANRASFCRLVAEIRPKDRGFLNGWIERCYRI